MELSDAVLARVDAVELVGQYVALAPSGRQFKGRCPFHEEKTPSFHVSPENGLFHCFGCKAGGNVINFIMRIENLEFRDALEWLARRYNIDPAQYARGGGAAAGASGEKERLFKLNEAAAAYYRKLLTDSAGEQARDYLTRRGVPQRAWTDFDLGYAPREWTALADKLLSEGAKAADLVKLGLIKPRSEAAAGFASQGAHYDCFRHRLIFPIRGVTGRVIGFAGRALSSEDQPKYLNVTNTPLYDKGKTLYNLDRAKGVLREEGVVVVEGYMDVIGLSGAGVGNAVASCGTALTPEHVKLLTRYADRFYLAFDGDEAGRRAAWSAGVLFLRQGLSVRALTLPTGVDPDELVLKHGAEAWEQVKRQASSVVSFYLEYERAKTAGMGPEQQRRMVLQLAPLYRQIPDELTRVEFKQEVASALRMGGEEVGGLLSGTASSPGGSGEELPAGRGGWRSKRDNRPSVSGLRPGEATKQELAAEQRDKPVREGMTRQRAKLQGARQLEREVLRRLLTDGEFRFTCLTLAELEGFGDWLTEPGVREAFDLLLAGEDPQVIMGRESFSPMLAEALNTEATLEDNEQLLVRVRNEHLKRREQELMQLLKEAINAGDVERERELFREVQELKRLVKPLRGFEGGG